MRDASGMEGQNWKNNGPHLPLFEVVHHDLVCTGTPDVIYPEPDFLVFEGIVFVRMLLSLGVLQRRVHFATAVDLLDQRFVLLPRLWVPHEDKVGVASQRGHVLETLSSFTVYGRLIYFATFWKKIDTSLCICATCSRWAATRRPVCTCRPRATLCTDRCLRLKNVWWIKTYARRDKFMTKTYYILLIFKLREFSNLISTFLHVMIYLTLTLSLIGTYKKVACIFLFWFQI